MGCVCWKSSSADDGSPKQRELNRKTSELLEARALSRNRNESFSAKVKLENHSRNRNESFSAKVKLENHGDIKIGSIDRRSNVSRRVRDDFCSNKPEKDFDDVSNFPSMRNLPKAVEGEQVAAGWPSWLVAVAGEAIKGWVPRKAETFEKLDKIGQGTYSSVYKGRDLLHNKVVALKKVRFDNMDAESVKFMAREILILRRLDHPNVIKLEGLVTSTTSCSLYLVFEYMEHDLTGLASLPGVKFTEPQLKCYMQQLLSGLDHCHSNGILHRDIKGSNLLINNHGVLKIADFGLASYFDNNNQKVPLTSRVVTLWYRPPELLLGSTQYGVAVDLWSTGCILGELYAGKPIMPGRTEVEQLHKIFKLCGSPSEDYWRTSKLPHSPVFKPIQPYKRQIAEIFKDFPENAMRLMETLLSIDPSRRGTASFALQSEFFKTEPFACDPSNLPKYPPSKEIDAKLREEEARSLAVEQNFYRKGAVGVKGHKCDYDSKKPKESRSAEANADLARSMQRRHENVVNLKKDEALNKLQSRAFSSVESRGKIASSCVGPTNQAARLSESFEDPMMSKQLFCGSQNVEKTGKQQEPGMERSSQFSGPLIATSNNIEQVLKEHDRRIQEAARRIRHENTRVCRIRPH
ncbi:protein kinase superfamily protein [Striga asiatica]|uniref:Protein kinase superfamily protein n=1 Tax=Striga asiatica TaxID=4170 RepID=A0A5A7R7A8_STRAF|nr:protein kinase superfamily protein [Striga asiatica]